MNITGAWLGTYWQDNQPTRFEATFAQGGNALSGSILDDNYLGEAQISGEVVGRSIRFTKRYLTSSPNLINYVGTLSEDANSMSGTWKIGRAFSGTWEAHRSNNDLMADLKNRLEQKVPAAATGSNSFYSIHRKASLRICRSSTLSTDNLASVQRKVR